MPEPEIARRCPSCGASIREQAFFCPQCGKGIKKSTSPDASVIQDTEEIIINDGATLTEADFQAARQKLPAAPAHKPPDRTKVGTEKSKPQGSQKPLGEVGTRLQRATTRARDVEDNVIHRVQKFREISSVVIDEAGYDPSLRFVLVAGALFVLFLVIVALNKLIG